MLRGLLASAGFLVASVSLLSCTSRSPAAVPSDMADRAPSITWHEWSAEPFDRARAEEKMVLVDVGIEGCTACRWMYEDTYRNPEVLRRVANHFIAVQVDAHVEPDIGERYARWGWPATIFFAPDGTQVFAVRGNKRPRNFIPILDRLIDLHKNEQLTEEAVQLADAAPAPRPIDELEQLCELAVRSLDNKRDEEYAGWGRVPKDILGSATTHAFLRGHARKDKKRIDHVLATGDAFASLLDPVWGGTFLGSYKRDWSAPIVEKRTIWTAAAMSTFAHAYHQTGKSVWKERAKEVDRYLRDWMLSADGTFYATQEDLAPMWPSEATRAAYFELSDTERREFGVPQVDHAVYTDLNGVTIETYAQLYEATGEESALAIAVNAAERILNERGIPGGGVEQTQAAKSLESDARMRPHRPRQRVFLRTQANFGKALLALYRVTGAQDWLRHAVQIADVTRVELEDETQGGFYSGPPLDTASVVPRQKPLRDNGVMAQFLLQLTYYTKDAKYETSARRALLAVAQGDAVQRTGQVSLSEIALAFEWDALGPVEFSIVGRPDEDKARALFDASLRVYEPRKVLHYEPEGRYPRHKNPSVYVCTRIACSSPIFKPERIAQVAKHFTYVDDDAMCGAVD